MKSQLLAGASSVAHLVGLGRLTAAGKPRVVPVVAGAPEASADVAAAPAVVPVEPDVGAAPVVAADPGLAVPALGAAPMVAPPADDEEDGENDDDEKDDDDMEMAGKGKKAGARRRERARCRAIMQSPHAAKNPGIAMHLALQTPMTRQAALALLEAMPKGAGGLDARMASEPRVQVGDGGARPGGAVAVASSWDKAFATTSRSSSGAANDSRSVMDRAMRRS
jgi:hypothetical protein